jgi:hypothetical protein
LVHVPVQVPSRLVEARLAAVVMQVVRYWGHVSAAAALKSLAGV